MASINKATLGNYILERTTTELKLGGIALKRPNMLRTH